MFALFQGSKDVYNEHLRHFVLAMAPLVITTISFKNFVLVVIWKMNSMRVSLTNEIFRFGNGIF